MHYKVEYKVVGCGISHSYRILVLSRPSESEALQALLRSGAIDSSMVARTEIKSISPA